MMGLAHHVAAARRRNRQRRFAGRLPTWLAAAAVAALTLGGLAFASAAQGQAPPPSGADWPTFLHDTGHSSYNAAATSITTSNVGNLNPVWRWLVPASPNSGSTELWSSPIVSNGVVYIGAEDGYFYAISEATRTVLWSDFLGLVTPTTCPGTLGVTSTATVADAPGTGTPTVYVNAPDGYLYAFDAATGTVAWKSVVAIPSTTVNNYYAWASPLVTNGNVYVGISSNNDCPLVQAGVVAFDQSTGAQVASWNSDPTGKPGASVWSSPAVTADGRIIAATGNGYKHSGEPIYNDSIVALDPNTLDVLDYWQIPTAEQITDGDFGASPTMFTATIGGVSTPMVGICNKNGYYYAFKQDDLAAGPVWQTAITEPYPGGAKECDAAAIWNGTDLIEGGGAPTTIGGTTYPGSVQALDPATGAPIWQTGLAGWIVGSPTEDGAGVVAAQAYESSGTTGVYLLSASTGKQLGFIQTPNSHLFGQAVFADSDLLIGAGPALGLTDYEVTTSGPPITGVSPSTIGDGTTDTVQLTGSGFTGTPGVFVSGTGVSVGSVTVVSSTKLDVQFTVEPGAAQTARDLSVAVPGSPPSTDTCSACLTIGPKPSKPAPTSINPSSFAQGSKSAPSTMSGSNFESGAVVTSHSGMSVKATYVSPTQLNLSVTVSASEPTGTYNLFVTNPDGLKGECTNCLTVTAAGGSPAAARGASVPGPRPTAAGFVRLTAM